MLLGYSLGDEYINHIDSGHCSVFREDRLKNKWRLAKDKITTHGQRSRSTKPLHSQLVECTEIVLYDS
jgi:hypothetical protein